MNYSAQFTREQIWEFLSEIPDPEIPVISITELGVVRDIDINNEKVVITITPTYTGCPAVKLFEDEITKKLNKEGIKIMEINLVYSPAWTTNWMSDKAKENLLKFGIAPPIKDTEDKGILFGSGSKIVECPRCKSKNTVLINQFGSTACKAFYKCSDCLEPFDYFKCI
jgi:ring-1,2-phenylacetyl-CoA epoxidase subunit PaaD